MQSAGSRRARWRPRRATLLSSILPCFTARPRRSTLMATSCCGRWARSSSHLLRSGGTHCRNSPEQAECPAAQVCIMSMAPRLLLSPSIIKVHAGRWPALRCVLIHTKHSQKAGPFSVARLKMDLPFHNRLTYNRVHRRSTSPPHAGTISSLLETTINVRGLQ